MKLDCRNVSPCRKILPMSGQHPDYLGLKATLMCDV